ncbi:hypothetical protein [Kumtagia ephedrae]|jgi:hypothetical protein|uniref:hypothetical protein n=1 Tax=Kumtagia ephedrae TaxID=2116701 RepID=UPI0014024A4B|nr:hypothetical protein [Mesorhizobium ephedrae]
MISYKKTVEAPPLSKEPEDQGSEQIQDAAVERNRKADTDGTRRRARQTAADNKLI